MTEYLDSVPRLATFKVEKVMVLILAFKIIFQIMNNISNNISNNGCFGFKMEQFESLGVHVE